MIDQHKENVRQALSCKLTSADFRKRKQQVLAAIKTKVKEKAELEFGFRYQFEGNDETLDQLIEFIKAERICCDFLSFALEVKDQSNPIELTISGYYGAKEFIASELEL